MLLDETDCDTWAHNKETLGEAIASFGKPEFKVIEEGNVRATLRVVTRYHHSTLQSDYSIMPGSKEVLVQAKVDFHEALRTLKLTFPVHGDTIITQIPYGTIARDLYTGEEPCGMWLACGNMCVANDSKYGFDSENGEVRLTILRSAIYADHYGFEDRDEFCEFMDQGIHEFSYRIFPYTTNAITEKRAAELNFGLRSVLGSFHKGNLPEKLCCFEADQENIIVSAIKEGEDKKGNVIRFYESDGKNTSVRLKIFDRELKAAAAHNALQTFLDNGRKVDLIEWEK